MAFFRSETQNVFFLFPSGMPPTDDRNAEYDMEFADMPSIHVFASLDPSERSGLSRHVGSVCLSEWAGMR